MMPEYGRHVQDMINYVKNIPDKEKRNEPTVEGFE